MSGPGDLGRASHPSGAGAGLVGRLLVSPPNLADPNFRHRVVLLLAHTRDGAFGLVINDPLQISAHDAMPAAGRWLALLAEPGVLYRGGPVEADSVVALARAHDDAATGWAWLLDSIGTIDLNSSTAVIDEVAEIRVFAGYAGWGPGQLEGEIADDGWFVVDAEVGDAFSNQPDELWSAAMRRAGGEVALMSTHPAGPSWN
jgi:putative transcriptional regulator